MHSRIIQITRAPVDSYDYLDENSLDYDHWFFHTIADYVESDEDRPGSIQWLKDVLTQSASPIEWHDTHFILRKGFHNAYYAQRHQIFIKQAGLLSTTSLEAFARGELGVVMFTLRDSYEDKYGLYVYDQDDNLITLDAFLRDAELDTPYYIGGTVDYHY